VLVFYLEHHPRAQESLVLKFDQKAGCRGERKRKNQAKSLAGFLGALAGFLGAVVAGLQGKEG
jgi:hypothetical protein